VLVVLVLVVVGKRQREVEAVLVAMRQQVAAAVGQVLVVLVPAVAGKRQRGVREVQVVLVGKRQQVAAVGQALVVLAGQLRGREAVVACLQQYFLYLSFFALALATLDLEVVPTLPTSAVGSVVMLLEAFLRVGMAKVQRQLAGEASP